MKTIYAVLVAAGFSCICTLTSTAQFKQVAESPGFEEPTTGHLRILQMKNGNTAFIHITPKDGIDLRIYDAGHQEKIVSNVELSIKRVKLSNEMSMFPSANEENIEGIFEINNDIVVFIYEYDPPKRAALCRVIIDGSTGKLKEETELFTKTSGSYYVEADAGGTGYFVCTHDYQEGEQKAQERIIYYDASHKEVNNWAFSSPEKDEGHALFLFKGMVVGENGKLFTFFTATGKPNDFKGNIYMVSVQKGSDKIAFNKPDLPADLYYVTALVKYDPLNRKIALLILSKLNSKSDAIDEHLNIIDPATMKMQQVKDFGPSATLSSAYAERFDKKKGYAALPQDMFINADGSIAIVYEEMMVQVTSSGNYTRRDTKLGKIVVSTIDNNGKQLSEYLVPKAQWVIFTQLAPMYHVQLQGKAQNLWRGNEYKVFRYIDGPGSRFIFFNDTDRNNEVKKDKFVEIQSVKDCDAFMYRLSGNDLFPARTYAFGEQKKDHSMAMFSVSEYDRKTNTLVTIKNDTDRGRKVKLVWLQPE